MSMHTCVCVCVFCLHVPCNRPETWFHAWFSISRADGGFSDDRRSNNAISVESNRRQIADTSTWLKDTLPDFVWRRSRNKRFIIHTWFHFNFIFFFFEDHTLGERARTLFLPLKIVKIERKILLALWTEFFGIRESTERFHSTLNSLVSPVFLRERSFLKYLIDKSVDSTWWGVKIPFCIFIQFDETTRLQAHFDVVGASRESPFTYFLLLPRNRLSLPLSLSLESVALAATLIQIRHFCEGKQPRNTPIPRERIDGILAIPVLASGFIAFQSDERWNTRPFTRQIPSRYERAPPVQDWIASRLLREFCRRFSAGIFPFFLAVPTGCFVVDRRFWLGNHDLVGLRILSHIRGVSRSFFIRPFACSRRRSEKIASHEM